VDDLDGERLMAALPVFPAFAFQSVPSIAVLNQVAYDATFTGTPPGQVLLTTSAAQSIPASTLTAITWGAAANTGPDTMWTSGSQLTAQTPGYYDLDAQVAYATSTSGAREIMFRVTTGASNPGGAGNTTIFGQSTATPISGNPSVVTTGVTSPYLYVLDYVEVLAYQTSSGALNTAAPWCLLAACLISLGP
jgi:hypothetical protein